MLSSLKVQDEKREEGFTLIELLVVVIIIGILAAIAIPVFLNQRENAYRSAVESDLRNAAIAMETLFTRDGNYTAADGQSVVGAGSQEYGGVEFTASDNVTITMAETGTNGQTFTITGVHDLLEPGENTLIYDSENGGLADATWQ
jgi:type IV pilus assembly protein PilA